ncbi:MAG: hypothetical protein A2W91_11255 [Bacteroidetes bacterium GWF2_38_335]|nr:MAG: hypothetical protein A2W91_11255 [Bacteroidetes bacterium GWF2_38_335]OFY81726.1 MAG: hypothetical protein A2281_05785 [Bacteroidetes bacterium RIFOXYA12_FULL_38_20]HBS87790.1 hypothetical protein [Bacteroidales bacterium]
MKNILPFFLFLVLFQTTCLSQKFDFKKDKYWLNFGAGNYCSVYSTGGIEWNADVNIVLDSTLYKIKYFQTLKFDLFGPLPHERTYNVEFMAGKGFSGKFAQVYFCAGLGIVYGIIRGKLLYVDPFPGFFEDPKHYERKTFVSPSIPVEIDITLKPVMVLGITGTLYGNLNFKRPMCGVGLKIGIGNLVK